MRFEDIKHGQRVEYRGEIWVALPNSFWMLDKDAVWLSQTLSGDGGMTVDPADMEPLSIQTYNVLYVFSCYEARKSRPLEIKYVKSLEPMKIARRYLRWLNWAKAPIRRISVYKCAIDPNDDRYVGAVRFDTKKKKVYAV